MILKLELFLKEKVLYISDNSILSYDNGYIYYRDKNGIKKLKIGTMCNKLRLIERMLRREPKSCIKLDETHYLFSFDGKIINYDINNNSASVDHVFDKGMNNPCSFLSYFNKATGKNEIYYGEYIWNVNKGPVSIFKRTNDSWKEVYQFSANSITHIHGIVHDPYRFGFLILTGDEDSESGIWFSDYNFSKVRPILVGKQQYRTCFAKPLESGIVYATDTPLENNHVFFIALDKQLNVINCKQEYDLPGPCIFGIEHGDNIFFSTSVEPDSSLPKWHYRVTNKLGAGVKTRKTYVITRDKNGKYSEICSIDKDLWPMWLFQFGNIVFPNNDSKDLYITVQATKIGHNITYLLTNNEFGTKDFKTVYNYFA